MTKICCLYLLACTLATDGLGYHIKVTNSTPCKIRVECNLVAWSNKSIEIAPYSKGEVNTVGWLTREISIDVMNRKTGTFQKKILTETFETMAQQTGSKNLIVAADPVLVGGTVDAINLFLLDMTSDQYNQKMYITGKIAVPSTVWTK